MSFQISEIVERDSDLWRDLNALPKIELHRHLEGSIRLETLCDVGRQFEIDLPAYDADGLRPYVQMTSQDSSSLIDFLNKFGVLRRFFLDLEVVERVVRESIEDAAADNIRYMELRFTPNALAKAKGYPLDEVVGLVCDTAAEASKANRIKTNLIVSMNRHEDLDVARRTLDAALKYQGCGVVGLDLAGKEPGFPAQPFAPLFREAKRAGLGITIHAGEWEGPENVRDAIENLRTDRIGHGVRIVEDSLTAQIAREYGVVFEVCPTSNIQTGVVGLIEHHPILDMLFLDLPITLNTDDPAVHPTTLTDEYVLAVQELGITLRDLNQMVMNAAYAAFLPEDERQELIVSLRREMGRSRYRGLES
jgi:adenosine deaminase